MSRPFNIGDVVRLKSGGPKMTIVREVPADQYRSEPHYACEWFAKNETAKSAMFPASVLTLAPKTEKKI